MELHKNIGYCATKRVEVAHKNGATVFGRLFHVSATVRRALKIEHFLFLAGSLSLSLDQKYSRPEMDLSENASLFGISNLPGLEKNGALKKRSYPSAKSTLLRCTASVGESRRSGIAWIKSTHPCVPYKRCHPCARTVRARCRKSRLTSGCYVPGSA